MKKILVLAFVSAAFLLSCSADGSLTGTPPPPAWKGGPASTPSGGGGGGGNPTPPPSGSYNFCVFYDRWGDCDWCESMSGSKNDDCTNVTGVLSTTCPTGCPIY